jgi:hypothetical protein
MPIFYLVEKGNSINFTANRMIIKNAGRRQVQIEKKNGLYCLQMTNAELTALATERAFTLKEVHEMLAHINVKKIEHLIGEGRLGLEIAKLRE